MRNVLSKIICRLRNEKRLSKTICRLRNEKR